MSDLCKIDGCKNVVKYKSLGLCMTHYARIWRNGTLELKPRSRQYRVEMPGRGYQRVYEPNHPLADTQGYVSEHRKIVYERYGENLPDCELCGAPINWKTVHVDHIDNNPRNNEPNNLRPLCRPCNTWRDYPPQHSFGGHTAITIDGVTKTATEWAREPGVKVVGATIARRKRMGASDYEAVYGEKQTHNGGKPKPPPPPKSTRKNAVNATIDGVTMTSKEWSRHPDCPVTDGAIRMRIRMGWDHKDAVFRPAHKRAA